MDPHPNDEFEGFRRETRHETARQVNERRSEAAGGLLLAAVLFGGAAIVWTANDPARLQVAATLTAVIAGGSLVALLCSTTRRPPRDCSECGAAYEVVDLPFPSAQLLPTDGYGRRTPPQHVSIVGSDGHVYQACEVNNDARPGRVYSVTRLVQRWHVCRRCRVRFPSDSRHREDIATLYGPAEWERLRDELTGEYEETMNALGELEREHRDESEDASDR